MRPAEIRAALARQIVETTGVRAYAYQPDKIDPPCVVVVPSGDRFIDPWGTMGDAGLCELFFTLTVVVPFVDDKSGFEQLDDYLSIGDGNELSILEAVQGKNLAGTVIEAHVDSVDGYGAREIGGARYIGADVNIVVRTDRS